MDCASCNVRSSVGFCAECRILLCEECGIVCDRCGKMVCPVHVYETSSGRQICSGCHAERDARRSKRKGTPAPAKTESTSFEALEGKEKAGQTEDAAVGAEALRASGHVSAPPWKLSIYAASAGLLGVMIPLIFPSIWVMLLPANASPFLSFLFILIPLLPALLAVLWSVMGILTSEYYEDRAKCLVGLGISVIAIVLALVSAGKAPGYAASRQDAVTTTREQGMTKEQLDEWRSKRLEKFSR